VGIVRAPYSACFLRPRDQVYIEGRITSDRRNKGTGLAITGMDDAAIEQRRAEAMKQMTEYQFGL